jgi:hypothetical protein
LLLKRPKSQPEAVPGVWGKKGLRLIRQNRWQPILRRRAPYRCGRGPRHEWPGGLPGQLFIELAQGFYANASVAG